MPTDDLRLKHASPDRMVAGDIFDKLLDGIKDGLSRMKGCKLHGYALVFVGEDARGVQTLATVIAAAPGHTQTTIAGDCAEALRAHEGETQ